MKVLFGSNFQFFSNKTLLLNEWAFQPEENKSFYIEKSQNQFCRILILIQDFRYLHKSVLHTNDAFIEIISR